MNTLGSSSRLKRPPSDEQSIIVVAERIHSTEPTDDKEKIVDIVQTLANKAFLALKADQKQYDRFARNLQLSNKTPQGRQKLDIKLPIDSFSWNDLEETDIQIEIIKRIVDSNFKWWESQVLISEFIPGSTMRYLNDLSKQDDFNLTRNNEYIGADKKLKQDCEPPILLDKLADVRTKPVATHSKKPTGLTPLAKQNASKPSPKVQIRSPLREPPSILKTIARETSNSTPFNNLRQQHLMRRDRLEKPLAPPRTQSKQASSGARTNYLMKKSANVHHIETIGSDDDDDVQFIGAIMRCDKPKNDPKNNCAKRAMRK